MHGVKLFKDFVDLKERRKPEVMCPKFAKYNISDCRSGILEKPGILGEFFEPGKLRKFVVNSV